ncbi:DUF1835 domain-containing protein [Dokdonia sinensis]|uniref:DUF1835 domain-containing protein n=1 Tax=Dokdonia sinensis TaxID=2479847 RepID=A0A3M0G6M9_9FLAO|nr:DUF1835 domain-containing protein [Dokdonia sinensis]RMB60585.1 DUF1835 domain-containing protein [Dokdonia sinensis]
MDNRTLHIVNGDSLGRKLQTLQYAGDYVTWREMLCEGPTTTNLLNKRFTDKRKQFLEETYSIPPDNYEHSFVSQLELLQNAKKYDEIILWFEYDLFCHLNMMACLRFLKKLKRKEKITLVCSGRVSGSNELLGLSELSDAQLKKHYEERVELTESDLDLAHLVWSYYSKGRVRRLKPKIAKKSNFKYLSSCLRAHKERFPDSVTGLNTLETTILKLIKKERIVSRNQLCGYALQHQGYYGFGDMQLFRIIDKMERFYDKQDGVFKLNNKGEQAINGTDNFFKTMEDDMRFGGNDKYGYVYDATKNKLIRRRR